MAATPKTGVINFRGLTTKTLYTKAIYNADVNGTYCRIDNGGGTPGATGGENFCKFGEPVILESCSFVTGIVDTLNLRVMIDYNPTNYTINGADCVNPILTRPLFIIGTRTSSPRT